jgi:hypothetical protein
VAALWLAACSVSPTPRLYVLSSPADPETVAGDVAGIGLGVGPVTLAPHLDRPQMVSRRGTEIHLDELERWAEPLADGIARTLAENLEKMLASDRLWLYPWPPSAPVDVHVAVDVRRFDDEGDGTARLSARWTLFGAGGMLATGRFDRREPSASADPAATVEALSRALAELSREIAKAVAEHATAGD